jgi:hypothetical protein
MWGVLKKIINKLQPKQEKKCSEPNYAMEVYYWLFKRKWITCSFKEFMDIDIEVIDIMVKLAVEEAHLESFVNIMKDLGFQELNDSLWRSKSLYVIYGDEILRFNEVHKPSPILRFSDYGKPAGKVNVNDIKTIVYVSDFLVIFKTKDCELQDIVKEHKILNNLKGASVKVVPSA